jgi:hypothetical protein
MFPMTPRSEHLVRALHDAPTMLVYACAGSGVRALDWLRGVDGSSSTLLEAHVDRVGLDRVQPSAGGAVGRAAVPAVAGDLARQSFLRALELAPARVAVVGVGCAAAPAGDSEPGVRRACVVVHGALGRHVLDLALRSDEREPLDQELLVSTLVLHAAATGCGVLHRERLDLRPGEALEESLQPAPPLAEVLAGRRRRVVLTRAGTLETTLPWPTDGLAIVAGSFDPLHGGHLGLAEASRRHLRRTAVFELGRRVVTKAPLGPLELYDRAQQFLGRADLLITDAPTFAGKAAILPGSVFVVGADTIARMLSRHAAEGGLEAVLDPVRAHGCRFLVAGRRLLGPTTTGDGGASAPPAAPFVALADLEVPAEYAELFEALPEADFRADVSSSLLRARSRPTDVDP